MDWNGNNLRHFVSRPECSYGFLYNYNYDQYQGMEMKHQGVLSDAVVPQGFAPGMEIKNSNISTTLSNNNSYINNQLDKKKRLTSDQLDSLERSFQEEIKLDPDRKMKLSRDLGLQPRQIAVWFQNRRARWKAKQLERLYDTLKQEFDVISKEKQKLQDEVMKLKAILRDQTSSWKQVSNGGYTEISGEETVESTSGVIRSSSKSQGTRNHHQMAAAECNHIFSVEEYNPVSSPPNYWGPLPSYPN